MITPFAALAAVAPMVLRPSPATGGGRVFEAGGGELCARPDRITPLAAFGAFPSAVHIQPAELSESPLKHEIEFPHPIICEVLYAVPTGSSGDASGDGARNANGDEFVELVNPHNKPIQLRGYRLSDRRPADPGKSSGSLQFVFPDLELKPGQVVVVFNGYEQKWSGPVGDSSRAPETPHDQFHGAYVFTMLVQSARVGLSNTGDFVLLTAPSGEAVQCVRWGDIDKSEAPPTQTKSTEEVPTVTGQSLQRDSATTDLLPHPEKDGVRFSPGWTPISEAVKSKE